MTYRTLIFLALTLTACDGTEGPQGPPGAAGRDGAKGAPGAPGTVSASRVVSETVEFQANEGGRIEAIAMCEDGEIVTGGGCTFGHDDPEVEEPGWTPISWGPLADGGWHCVGNTAAQVDSKLTAYALCAD